MTKNQVKVRGKNCSEGEIINSGEGEMTTIQVKVR